MQWLCYLGWQDSIVEAHACKQNGFFGIETTISVVVTMAKRVVLAQFTFFRMTNFVARISENLFNLLQVSKHLPLVNSMLVSIIPARLRSTTCPVVSHKVFKPLMALDPRWARKTWTPMGIEPQQQQKS